MKKRIFFLATILTTNLVFSQIPTNGLVGYWPFNGNADDESGNGYDGTVYGALLTLDRFGNANCAYSFDGIDDYIEIGDDDDLDIGLDDFSISVWINSENNSGYSKRIIAKINAGNSTDEGYALILKNEDLNSGIRWDWESIVGATSGVTLNSGEWHHIVAIFNRNGDINVYIDGIINNNATTDISSYDGNDINANGNLFIGRHCQTISSYYMFDGIIDDIRIYNLILTTDEITALYNENTTPETPPPTNSWQPNGNNIFYDGIGNIGIGTENPAAKLTVNGPVLATEVKVKSDISTFPDFVFKPGYNLRSLKETEVFIIQNGHLPGIPSAKEVEKEGVSLGEMNAKLLQKIEELTLYTVSQQKEIEILKKQNEEMKKEIKELKEK